MNESEQNQSDSNAAMCCAQFYEQDIVQELMGGSFHPGGEDLSRTLARKLELKSGSSVLDVACGVGTTTRMVANEFALAATGLDFSAINVRKATEAATESLSSAGANAEPCCAPGDPCCTPDNGLAQLGGNVANPTGGKVASFVQGSADALPFDDGVFDGVLCECAVSTFSDQAAVAAEFFRVLKSGGCFGMTDMVLNGELPQDFSEKAAPWTCVAKALDVSGYQALFEQAGFELIAHEDQSHTLIELATEMKRKLVMAGMGKALGALPSLGMNFSEMRAMLGQSTELVKAGTIQYGLLIFRKPA